MSYKLFLIVLVSRMDVYRVDWSQFLSGRVCEGKSNQRKSIEAVFVCNSMWTSVIEM